ncbi:Lysosomal alpha-glucosidase [Portunus trituberculatus]|uniref:Lysosomal alpha-glucosidase n=1 Tax=Portunus trituberculatus TaxID=210409 RepID=A0A5B7J3U2_PORTR|nr:Lysosomal alpha-glucosidase [Portunus trituberculatus]
MVAGAYITWPEGTNQSVIQDNNDGALGSVMLGYVWPENKTAFPNFFSAAAKKWWTEEIKTFYADKIKFDGLWIVSVTCHNVKCSDVVRLWSTTLGRKTVLHVTGSGCAFSDCSRRE